MFENYCQKPTFSGAVVNIVNSSYLKACCWSSPHVVLSKIFFPCKNNNQESFSGIAAAITMQTFDVLGIFFCVPRGPFMGPYTNAKYSHFFPTLIKKSQSENKF